MIAIRVGLIAAVAALAWVGVSFLTANQPRLHVGDCFTEPSEVDRTENTVVPCSQPHDGEVLFVGDVAPATDAFPSDDAFFEFETDRCLTAFQQYTGIDFTVDQRYGMAPIRPTAEEWRAGQRKVVCYVYQIDGSKLTESIRKT